ncbi:LAME_0F03488g1_1 [Lachancea meyersii CBS 8951]|uniref:LAME_0F03488g1_1 n=1 Tax=Lachancea meyersii CBS 8951 TaxID=1266667 RepID=A0A1G4JRP4_9SACH|nr:LAME_0F03488g1_1 [Lachancea meyersii CBS 8951]
MKILFVLGLSQFWCLCAAVTRGFEYTNVDYVGFSCKNALASTAKFCKKDSAKDYSCYCTSDSALGSFFYCAYDNLKSKKDRQNMQEFFQFRCPNTTFEHMQTVYENATQHMVNTSEIKNFNASAPVDFYVYVNSTLYDIAYRSYNSRYSNFKKGYHWGAVLVGYWGIIVVCGMFSSLVHKFAPTLAIAANKKMSQLALVRWYRKYFSIPALFGNHHTDRVILGGLLPTRLESFLIFGFCFLCIIFQAVGYDSVKGNTLFATKTIEMSRLIGDRTGVVANFLMILTYLFAGRNQIFMWMTGWKQSTFIAYHKWIGRMCFLSVLAHTIAMLINTLMREGVYEHRVLENYWRYGSVAVVAGGIIFVQAFSWLRVKNYELFLYVHIAMALAFLIGAWRHIDEFYYGEWAYATAAFWCFDRFIRLVRLCCFGIKTAKVCIVSNETLQITVDKGSWWPFFPGAFGYLHILKTTVFWQSHPFTVVKTDNNELRFYIKIKKGVTETLYEELLSKPNYTGEVKVAVEGPYGDNKPADAYDQVLLYSGGNGIPGPFAYAKELGSTTKEGNIKFVKLYWVIRHWHSMDWFLEELQLLQKYSNVQTIIYVTKAHEGKLGEKLVAHFDTVGVPSSSSEKGSEENEVVVSNDYLETVHKMLPHIEFREGRPSMEEIVSQDIDECGNRNVAVITCGHGNMCDQIRHIVADKVGTHKTSRIDFFEELQTW